MKAHLEEMGINKHVLDEGTWSATMLVSTNALWTKAHGVQLCWYQQTHSGRRHTEYNYAAIEEMGINKHILDEGTWSATMLE